MALFQPKLALTFDECNRLTSSLLKDRNKLREDFSGSVGQVAVNIHAEIVEIEILINKIGDYRSKV